MQDIIEIIENPKYKGYDVEQFKQVLNAQGKQEFVQFMKALNALEEDYIIMRDAQNRFYTLQAMQCIKGSLAMNAKGYGFIEDGERSVYVNKEEAKKALDKDEVLGQIIHNKDGSVEAKIIKVISHNKKFLIGVIKKKKDKTVFLPDAKIYDRRFKILNLKEFKLVNDTKVQVFIESYGDVLLCSIVKVLGHKYDPGVDILSVLMDYDIEPTFPKAVMREVNKIDEEISAKELVGRMDLREHTIITIDGDDSKDLDDAIHVERRKDGYRLGVHIADVSHYVKAGSAIDKEAYKRATSVYVCDRVVPMLPQALSNGICSLNPRVERLTMSCIMDIDFEGNITSYQIVPSVIKTKERMTYKNVNKIIHKNKKMVQKYEHILGLISNMLNLSHIIRKKRHDAGNIDFDTRESKVVVDAKGRVKDIVLRERGESERIIEDFMILANECVAAHSKYMDLPSIYRIHEKPDAKKIRDFVALANTLGYSLKGDLSKLYPKQLQQMLEKAKGDDAYPVLSTNMLRSMQKARYDINCLGHFGLALEEYTHFTSPIRRYPDLIVHRMMRKYYFDNISDVNQMKRDCEWIEEAAEHTSSKERNAVNAEREVDDMKKAEFMEKYVGCVFEGVIGSVTKFGMFVELENTVEGLVHISQMKDDYYTYEEVSKSLIGEGKRKRYRMGQKVVVRVVSASRFKREIDFEIIEG